MLNFLLVEASSLMLTFDRDSKQQDRFEWKITASSKLQPAFHLRSSLLVLLLSYEYMNKNGIISTEITPQLSPVIVALFNQVATLTAALTVSYYKCHRNG